MSKKLVVALLMALVSVGNLALAQKNGVENTFEVSKNLDIYYALMKEMNEYYVDPIQPGKMVKKSIDEMLRDLDPYTNYITEDDIEDYRFQTTGKYGGIGCSMRDLGEFLALDELYENGPAAKSGLQAGDIILSIDGKSVKNMKDENISKLIKGSPGTQVKFKVRKPLTNQEVEKTITREEIAIKNITYSGLVGADKNIGIVRLNQFTERAGTNIKNALDSLKRLNPNMQGVIIDLRNNPGGLLDEAVNICNLFIGREQLVVSTKGKNIEWDKNYKTSAMPWDETIPLAILVNKGSASASEIVSGTMQDLDRGIVVGQRSYGKGLVQSTRSLPFNAKLKVTTAKYYTPSGRCIQALDYSHRNEDGSVGEIPDSVKKMFTTKAGRKVYDGGGVDPDIKTTVKEYSRLSGLLASKHFMFDYATDYVSKHASIDAPEKFVFTNAEADAFIAWLEKKDYNYKSKTVEAIERMKEVATKEKYFDEIKPQYEALLATLTKDKKQDLEKNKEEIRRLLQAEIVTRYYYLKGRAVNDLQDDEEVKEAVKVLTDKTKLAKILSK
jgi:carboxyl-terminal processing protease